MPSETQVPLPAKATVDLAGLLIDCCQRAEVDEPDVVLDCRSTTYLDPFAVALLASSIAIRESRGQRTQLLLPTRSDSRAFFTEVGLDAFALGKQTGVGTLEVRQMRGLDASYVDAVIDILVRGVLGITEENSYSIRLCLNELLQNVFEWAASPVGCFVLARWYHKSRSVRLAVVDRGVGIPTTLRGSTTASMHDWSDQAIIQAAAEVPQLTARANQRGGLGLKHIREVVLDRHGSLTVVSLTAKVSWSPGGEEVSVEATSVPIFQGTAIELEFKPDAEVERPTQYVPVF